MFYQQPICSIVLMPILIFTLFAPPDTTKKPAHTNRLARESSPYLLLHAHNPVEWYPWCPEAFEKAKAEDKPIFLSIGYSSCYWCHVMERQSFQNEEIAKLMNDWFVCIKVDREERPDVDSIYMTALQVQGQRGGWPLSMFMTPDGKPIGGGTYWPPEDREIEGQKVYGFKSILRLIHEDWEKDRETLTKHADRVADHVNQALVLANTKLALTPLDRQLLDEAIKEVKGDYDPLHGGFGSESSGYQPKFPTPPTVELLLHEYERTKNDVARSETAPKQGNDVARSQTVPQRLKIVTHTLDRMALGGIYDHLGGGFHRYSTDREWKVPHFEKMLYDNAQLVSLYSRAYRLTKKPLYRRVVEETLAFIEREMTSPEGGFYSALDAESEAEEGKFYVWTAQQISDALPEARATFFKTIYGFDSGPNFEHGTNVLLLRKPLDEAARATNFTEDQLLARLKPLKEKLLSVREQRTRPLLDVKVLTAWNGLMIAGYADAAQHLENPAYAKTAERAAEFVLSHLRNKNGRMLRTYTQRPDGGHDIKLNAYLEDYAFLVHGLLSLHEATNNPRWLTVAKSLHDTMAQHFHDQASGGFFFTSHDHEKLFARTKDQYDGATPSGNSVAALNLVRLARLTGDDKYAQQAQQTFKAFSLGLKSTPRQLAAMARALSMSLEAAQHNQ